MTWMTFFLMDDFFLYLYKPTITDTRDTIKLTLFGFGAGTIRQRKRIDISRKVEIFINLANFFTLLFHFHQEAF